MHEHMIDLLEELCETALKELEMSNEKLRKTGGELTAGDVDYLDKLTHMIKSIKATMAMIENESYSGRGGSYARGGRGGQSRNGGYSRGGSYARGNGRRRDSMGRYSSEGGYSRDAEDMVDQLRDMMDDAPDERTRQDIQRLISKMEQAQ